MIPELLSILTENTHNESYFVQKPTRGFSLHRKLQAVFSQFNHLSSKHATNTASRVFRINAASVSSCLSWRFLSKPANYFLFKSPWFQILGAGVVVAADLSFRATREKVDISSAYVTATLTPGKESVVIVQLFFLSTF